MYEEFFAKTKQDDQFQLFSHLTDQLRVTIESQSYQIVRDDERDPQEDDVQKVAILPKL